ncbi:MAG: HD domain-containing protein [Pseudomonadota bacterium]|jgi:hypothetical protein
MREVVIEQVGSDEFQKALKGGLGTLHFTDTEVKPFDPLSQLDRFEIEFPEQMKLFRLVGIHPTESTNPINPYTKATSTENFSNIGEHCIAVAHCASKIAALLVQQGLITDEDARWITERALVHDLNKPFEIMRRYAQKAGLAEDVYSVTAYEKLKPLLDEAGIAPELSEYLIKAGAETGHNSLKTFIVAGPDGYEGLVSGMVAEKIVHLADDMTFTNNPKEGQRPITAFMTCWERMLASQFIEKYPFLWNEGLVASDSGAITGVRDLKQIPEGQKIIGNYAELQVRVANSIARELQLLVDPGSPEKPESFIRRVVNAD